VKDIGIAVSEEIQPYNWRIALEAENGTVLGTVSATGFYTVLLQRKVAPDAVYRLRLTGTTTGACLHLCGVPAVVCPDAESARLIHGGLDVAAKGRATFHGSQRRLLAWADALTAAELTVAERPLVKDKVVRSSDKAKFHLSDVPRLLASQDLDPASPTYGSFQDTGDKAFEVKFSFWSQKVDDLAMVAGLDDPGNPYRGDPALVRRVLLNRATAELLQLSPFFWFEHNEGPKEYKPAFETFWDMPFRSAWFPMHDAAHVKSLRLLKGVTGGALAPDILAAWVGMYEQWAMARLLMHQGECSNQWAAALSHVAEAMEATGSPQIQEVLSYQVKRIVTPGNLGRVGPEATPFGIRSRIAYTLAADCGYAGAGYLADGLGHDGEYCLETEGHLSRIYEVMPDPGIVRYLNDYYWLKTHLTLPKAGVPVKDTFAGTCSPTDSNHRTRYYTHKTPLSDALRAQVRYGDLWAGKPADGVTWPCLEAKPFVRNVDNEYYFINTPGYYSMVFAGQANYDWTSFGMVDVTGASARFAGYTGMHYGGFGRKATKCAGISTVFVRNCGPTLLSQNHNVMFSNVVWGRRREPVSKRWEEHFVDPLVVCSGYAQPHVTVDETTRVCTRLESIPDVPLQVYRMIVFGHEAIDVRLVLTATGDVDLRELYECLPYYAEKRTVRLFAADFAEAAPFAIPKILVHETREATPRGPLSGENPELPDLNFRAMDIAAASGAGSSVVFDRAYTFRQTQPVRYRAVAAGTGAFNLVLPARYRPGDRVEVRYTIAAHQTAVAPDQLRQIAESAMPANGDSSGARRVPGRSP
jgi:hypothetical protein